MPKSTRDWAIRHLDASCGNIDWALDKLVSVSKVYMDAHPEIAQPLDEIAAGLMVMRDTIQVVRHSF